MSAFVELSNVSKSYLSPDGGEGVEVFSEVDLQLSEGESAAIVGPSGSGKSTLLNVVGALDKPSGGKVTVGEREVTELSPEEAQLGASGGFWSSAVTQQPGLAIPKDPSSIPSPQIHCFP